MAFQKAIQNPRTGVTAEYWRVVLITIAPADGSARIMLGGYVNANIRTGGGIYVDSRVYDLGPLQFAALAASQTNGPTMFDAIGSGCYSYIRNARRPCQIDPDTGEGIAQDNGNRYPAEQIVMIGGVPTVPSEFADAVDV